MKSTAARMCVYFLDMRLGRMRPMMEERTVIITRADKAPRNTCIDSGVVREVLEYWYQYWYWPGTGETCVEPPRSSIRNSPAPESASCRGSRR